MNDKYHAVPINDLRDHSTDSDNPCWRRPREEDGVIVHNSIDGRESTRWVKENHRERT